MARNSSKTEMPNTFTFEEATEPVSFGWDEAQLEPMPTEPGEETAAAFNVPTTFAPAQEGIQGPSTGSQIAGLGFGAPPIGAPIPPMEPVAPNLNLGPSQTPAGPPPGFQESLIPGTQALKAPLTKEVPATWLEKGIMYASPGSALAAEALGPDVPAEVGRRLWNQAVGLGEFTTSPAGVYSLASSMMAPVLTQLGFTGLMIKDLVQNVPEVVRNWANMSTAEQAGALTDILTETALTAMIGKGAYEGVKGNLPKGTPAERKAELQRVIEEASPPEPEPAAPAVEVKGAPDAKIEEQKAGGVPPEQREPTVGQAEGQAESGTAQRGGEGEKVGLPQPEVLLKPTLEIGGQKFYGATHSEAMKAAGEAFKAGKLDPTAYMEAVVAESQKKLPHQFERSDTGELLDRAKAAELVEDRYPGTKVPKNEKTGIPELQSEWYNEFMAKKAAEPPKAASPAPPSAPAKMQEQVTDTAKTKGTRTAKEIKAELVASLEKAVTDAPSRAEFHYYTGAPVTEKATKASKTITISIPDDGEFKVINLKENIAEVLSTAKRLSTSQNPPKLRRSQATPELADQAKSAATAYGSPENAYKSTARQIETLREQGPPDTAEDRKTWNDQIMAGEALMSELYGDTKAGILEAKAEAARDRLATYKEGAKGFESEIDRIEAIKRKTKKHKERLEYLKSRYSENQEFIRTNERNAKQWEQEAAKEKAALESKTPPEPPPSGSLPQGPGARAANEPMPPELQQLENALGALPKDAPAKSYWGQRIRESFAIGERLAEGKDALAKGLSGLRATGAALWQKMAHYDKFTPWLKILGENQLAREQSSLQARRFANHVLREMPVLRDIRTREAISKWVEADGDPVKLQKGVREAPAGRKRAYQDALTLSPDAVAAARHVQSYFEARLGDAIQADVLEGGIENYIHRIYEKNSSWKSGLLADLHSGRLSTARPDLAKRRVFEMDLQAEKAGYKPTSDFLERVINYDVALNRAIADRTMVKQAMDADMPDGRPMFDVAGTGEKITDEEGLRVGTVVKPRAKPSRSTSPVDNRGDYIVYDHPAFRKWKVATTDSNGQPIYVHADALVHPDAIKTVRKLLDKSVIRDWEALGMQPGRAALMASGIIKQTMLDLSGFHMVQEGVHGLEHRAIPLPERIVGGRGMPELNLSDPKQAFLVSHGLTVADVHNYQMYTEGNAGSALAKVPVLGPLLTANHEFLFKEFIPRLKMSMALHALERNRKAFRKELGSGRMTEDDLGYLTAKQGNAAFGGLNYEMIGRSKTAQDVTRLAALAPDFLEARARFAGQAATRYGTEQRKALVLGVVALYVTARVLNQVISGNPHNELENALSLVVGGRSYSLRTVQGDIMHLINEPSKFTFHRLNPVYGRTALEFLSGRDEFGRKRTYPQQAKDLASTAVPISLRSNREQKLWESLLNAFGVTNRRWDAIASMYKAAEPFRKGSPVEPIYDPEKDPLRDLKNDLLYNTNDGDASLEIQKLLDKGDTTIPKLEQHFKRYASGPFTGNKANDREMFESLSDADQKVFREAMTAKREIYKRWREALAEALLEIRNNKR